MKMRYFRHGFFAETIRGLVKVNNHHYSRDGFTIRVSKRGNGKKVFYLYRHHENDVNYLGMDFSMIDVLATAERISNNGRLITER
ncbi:hypothetical protein [Pantoea ananatis]|uniref:hypothetical protein n=1 Tax=Pantoea ananas TaxID=553 RepID=UPI001B31278A|nr:hypothetical protein [Pantoea ananatis]